MPTMQVRIVVACLVALAGCNGSKPAPPPVSGLDQRPSNTQCIAGKRPVAGAGVIQVLRAFPALSFSAPVVMVQAPDSDARWYVAEKAGMIYSFANVDATTEKTLFIDHTAKVNPDGEGGLLGVAFHPDYANNGQVFLSFTRNNASGQFASQISRFTVNTARTALDPASELQIMQLRQPYTNHNGGNITFGPKDGFLYFGLGDGGSGGDPENHGQDTRTLLGAMLRIDINGATPNAPYKIPNGNAFIGNPTCPNGLCPDQALAATAQRCTGNGCPEIFAWGLRNPWRWSFDRLSGDLWAGDVGQYDWEEVDLVQANKNYGWGCFEGTHRYTNINAKNDTLCPATLDHALPVTEYDHGQGSAITGGYVYHGSDIPTLTGNYLYSDSGSGKIWALADPKSATTTVTELLDTSYTIVSFGEGNDGELYVLDYYGGIYKIAPAATLPATTFPAKLSATGCANDANLKDGSSGMIPFDVNSPLWLDGAEKKRWLALPDNTTINIANNHDWVLPPGSILRKDFYLDNAIVETRLLAYHTDGDWAGYSYEWNADKSDATLLTDSKTVVIGSHTWYYPNGSDCLRCHTVAAGRSLGVETAQLNRDYTYATTGKTGNQVFTFSSIGLFDAALSATPAKLPVLTVPGDTSKSLAARARAYLHANCSHCHRPGGPGRGEIDLRYDVALNAMGVCNKTPQTGDLGVTDARVLYPGVPEKSVLSLRLHSNEITTRMPPLARNLVDTQGTKLIDDWIRAVTSCP